MEKVYVGLDTASRTCHWQAKDREGAVILDRQLETSEVNFIRAVEETPGEVHVHLEASELAGWIRGILKGRVASVVVSDPKASAWISNDARKHDRMDAGKLSDLLRLGLAEKHSVYYSDDQDRVVFKQIVQHYDAITREEARLKQKIKACLRVQGVIARGHAVYEVQGRQGYLKQVSSPVAREAIQLRYDLLDRMLQTQEAARKLMRREARRYAEIPRFDQVPGVGLVGACRYSAYVQTPYRFSSKRKLWRYSKLGITHRSSDNKPLSRQALDWNGNGTLKDMSRKSFEGAMRTRADNMFKRAYRKSLASTGNKDHARLSTQRKILAVLRAMWKEGTDYRDDKG